MDTTDMSKESLTDSETLRQEMVKAQGLKTLLKFKAKQSIQRNLEREDAAILRDEKYQEQLLYEAAAAGDKTEETDEETAMPDEDELLQVGDVAGNITLNVQAKESKPKSLLSKLGIPLAMLAAGMTGGVGLGALAYQALKPDSAHTVDTDTIGALEIDKDN